MSKVGRLISLHRQVTHRTLADLAAATGRSEDYLQKIEKGMLSGMPATLLALADELGISLDTMRDAYLQDAANAAATVWDGDTKCKLNCIEIPLKRARKAVQ